MGGGAMEEGTAALQQAGNAHFTRGEYEDALRKYAAALASLQGKSAKAGDKDTPKDREAALRSNRSLCHMRLGQHEQALAEAEQCLKVKPDWAKAHFRKAAALEALRRLGDARLATCEALRLAPSDAEVAGLQRSLRGRLFQGNAAKVGEALDVLEDFQRAPGDVLAAAREIRDSLAAPQAAAEDQDDEANRDRRADCIRAFIAGAGSSTVFRRQNAMGSNWREECKNGTMSLLSEVSKAVPQLEEELVRLNQEADARSRGCNDGVPGCRDERPVGKAGDAATVKDEKQEVNKLPADVPAPVDDMNFGFGRQRRRRGGGRSLAQSGDAGGAGAATDDAAPAADVLAAPVVEPVKDQTKKIAAESLAGNGVAQSRWPKRVAQRVLDAVPYQGALSTFAAAAAVNREWASTTSTSAPWGRWAEAQWPGFHAALPLDDGAGFSCELMQRLAATPSSCVGTTDPHPLKRWAFVVTVRRGRSVLWRAAVGSTHALPAALGPGPPAESATIYERSDVVMPGDKRRLAVAGAVAALAAANESEPSRRAADELEVRVSAVRAPLHHGGAIKAVALPASLHAGSRRSIDAVVPPPASVSAATTETNVAAAPLLHVAVGLGAQHVLPGPRTPHPAGSLQVRLGLTFAGPTSSWIVNGGGGQGGALLLAGLLEAACS
eukprot:CAMPEP_0117462634 /NCGR_PEP_ID=MMETSP0784-20121206/3156_1 /TAXON_ID=39447 /ORGANISM="" /LENGTH=665 /DNA_ID=CAMNT_0005256407 /DNA_START=60 /DNA_END=2054 /DNA_ORIENTATION=-